MALLLAFPRISSAAVAVASKQNTLLLLLLLLFLLLLLPFPLQLSVYARLSSWLRTAVKTGKRISTRPFQGWAGARTGNRGGGGCEAGKGGGDGITNDGSDKG